MPYLDKTLDKKTKTSEEIKKNDIDIFIIAAMVILSYFLWDTPVLYPIKLFVVLLHEISHGISAMLFGGRIVEIFIDPRIGGHCSFVMPKNFFGSIITASSGYLGSIFWGCIMLFLGIKTKLHKSVLIFISFVVLLITALFVRDFFGVFFCLIFGAFLAISALKLSDLFNSLLLKFLGTVSCLYAIIDIKEDLIARTVASSDSYVIASMLGMPFLSVAIGVFWIILSIAALVGTSYYSFKSPD